MAAWRALVLVAALLALLSIIACGDGEDERTPTAQPTTVPTSAAQGSGTSPVPQSTAAPEVTVAPEVTATSPATIPVETPTGGAIEMGIDVDTQGNTANTLGTIESCVRLDVPNPSFDGVSDHTVDVYVKGATDAPLAYDGWVTYAAINDGCPAEGEAEVGDQCLNSFDDDNDLKINDGCPQVGASGESGAQCANDNKVDDDGDAIVHVAAPDTDTLIKLPGAEDLVAEPLPDSDGTFASGVIYLQGGLGVAGDGALLRLGLDIGGSGVVTLVLNPPPLSAYASSSGLHSVALKPAKLAINVDCPQ